MLNKKWFVYILFTLGTAGSVLAQTEFADQTTFSENGDCAACSVTNPQFAVDANTTNFSRVEASAGAAGGFIEQTLIFPSNGRIGDSLVIGLQLPDGVTLNSVDNVFFETFVGASTNNDRRVITDPAIMVSSSQPDNRYDLYFLTSYPYDRVSVRLEAGGVVDTLNLFYANKTKALDLPDSPCQKPVAQSTTENTSCVDCGFDNPENAADNDESSFAVYRTETGLFPGGFIEQNFQFGEAGFNGDTIRFFIEDPSGNLAANNFDNIEIRTALGPDANNDTKTVGDIDAPFVSTGGNRYTIKFVVRNTFDIATVRMNVTGGFQNQDSLYMYYACRVSKDTPPDTVVCQQAMFESNGADPSCTGCQVNNSNDAVDGDDATASTLTLGTFATTGTVFQEFEMPFIGGDQDRYTVRMSNPNGNINDGNLGNIYVETLIGQTPNNDRRVLKESDLTVIGGPMNLYDYTFEGFQPYDRIKVSLDATTENGITSLNIFYVCNRDINVDTTVFIPCENADSTSNSAEATCFSCDVVDPVNVLDNDDDSYSILQTEDATGGFPPPPPNSGSVQQTIIFPESACGNDSLKVILGSDDMSVDPNGFTSVTIYLFNNPGPSQDTVATLEVDASDLTQIPTTSKFRLSISPGAAWSAAQMKVTVDQLATEHRDIRWYSACMTSLYPAIPLETSLDVCYDESVTLFANTVQENSVPTWWTAPTGGTLVFTGSEFTTPPLQDDTAFYVQATDTTTGCASDMRRAVNINVFLPVTDAVLDIDSVSLCFGEFVTIVPRPFGDAFNFYADAAGNDRIYRGTELYLFPIISDSTIYVQHISKDGCLSDVLVPFNIYLKPITPVAELREDTVTVCKGGSTDLIIEQQDTVEALYFWYTQEFGGQEVFNGDSLRLTNILADTSFYVERVSQPCGPALERKLVTVFAIDEIVTTPVNDSVFVCKDSVAFLEAQTDVTGAEIRWYDAMTGGNLLGTGSPFTYPIPNDTSVTIYVGSTLDQCEEPTREPVIIYNVDSVLKLMAYDTTICYEDDILIGVRPIENGATVQWFDAETGGNLVGTGDSISVVDPQDSTSFYAEITYSSNCPAERVEVNVHVTPELILSVAQDTIYYCTSEQPTFMANKSFSQINVSWFNSENGTGLIGQGDDFTFSPVGDTTTVWFEGNYLGCTSGSRQSAVAIFADQIAIPQVSDTVICEGLAITLAAGIGVPERFLVWYDQPSGGNVLFTGNDFTTNPLFSDTVFYVGVDLGTYCNNLPRVPIEVEITNQLAPPTMLVCDSNAQTLRSVRFNWTPNPVAAGYEVSIDGGPWIIANTGSAHVVNGLNAEDCVSIEVRSIGTVPCETSVAIGPFTCCAASCDSIPAYILPNYEACIGESVTIQLIGDPLNLYEYSYNNGNSYTTNKTFTYFPTASETFDVLIRFKEPVAQAECPVKVSSAQVTVHDRPVVDFTVEPDVPITAGTNVNLFKVTFTGVEEPGNFYHYTFFDENGTQIGQSFTKDGTVAVSLPAGFNPESDFDLTVCLRVDDINGCDTEVCKNNVTRVFQVEPLFIPSGFTPDESTNNTLQIKHEDGFVDLESFTVFNKYGNIVFETTNITDEWDGTNKLGEPQPSGVYIYTAKVRDDANNIIPFQGSITLIR